MREASEEEVRRYYRWREHVSAHLPRLSARVFSLRGRMYMGCGFHYALESTLGAVIHMVRNGDQPTPDAMQMRVDRVIVRQFCKRIREAERSAAECADP
jgi:hypothetical protein